MWSVVESFFDHRIDHHSFITEDELRNYLINKLYGYCSFIVVEDNFLNYEDDTETLIKKVRDISGILCNTEDGGVMSVHFLDLKHKNIIYYN